MALEHRNPIPQEASRHFAKIALFFLQFGIVVRHRCCSSISLTLHFIFIIIMIILWPPEHHCVFLGHLRGLLIYRPRRRRRQVTSATLARLLACLSCGPARVDDQRWAAEKQHPHVQLQLILACYLGLVKSLALRRIHINVFFLSFGPRQSASPKGNLVGLVSGSRQGI